MEGLVLSGLAGCLSSTGNACHPGAASDQVVNSVPLSFNKSFLTDCYITFLRWYKGTGGMVLVPELLEDGRTLTPMTHRCC